MTRTLLSPLRRAVARLGQSWCTRRLPFAVVVALVAAIASSFHASGQS